MGYSNYPDSGCIIKLIFIVAGFFAIGLGILCILNEKSSSFFISHEYGFDIKEYNGMEMLLLGLLILGVVFYFSKIHKFK